MHAEVLERGSISDPNPMAVTVCDAIYAEAVPIPRAVSLLEVPDGRKVMSTWTSRVTVSMHDIVVTFEPHRPLVANLARASNAHQPEMMIRSSQSTAIAICATRQHGR
jgi:hypothetical protein